ncbi:hypothetical protein [Streptomyces sp. TP-A0356]|uniref:hypothetical protein n=1 Tax=Streptomyces sp. TP-A0356 TaxID=1359208 RepID=UPI001F468599|nr:hypothetical protein [Streptomyces sp. TP-A0356]
MADALRGLRPGPCGRGADQLAYERRRAAFKALFADHGPEASLTLCPSTTEPETARGWLEWTAAGLEGLCFKRLDEPYRPARSWRQYKVWVTTEAIIGAVTGSLAAPRTVLLSRYATTGRLRNRSANPVKFSPIQNSIYLSIDICEDGNLLSTD